MPYGQNGTPYKIGPTSVKIDEKFIISSLVAIIAFLGDAIILPDGIEVSDIIEGMASAIYDNITNESENAGEPTPTVEERTE